jgi:hypothetical protein
MSETGSLSSWVGCLKMPLHCTGYTLTILWVMGFGVDMSLSRPPMDLAESHTVA